MIDTVEQVIELADKYNFDRDSVMKNFAFSFISMVEIGTFSEYKPRSRHSHKCAPPDGVTIKLDGKHPLDPCEYEVKEIHRNVTVEVIRCRKCGHTEISWRRQEDTEDF